MLLWFLQQLSLASARLMLSAPISSPSAHAVIIQQMITSVTYYYCGGTIISRWNVLTAAHCMHPESSAKIEVRSGSASWDDGYTLSYVESYTMHENYSVDDKRLRSGYDIAVIRLTKPYYFNPTVQPVKLFGADDKVNLNDAGLEYGWGQSSHDSLGHSPKVKSFRLRVVDTRECNKTYESWGGLMPGQFCAKSVDKNHYPCYGDSGTGLIVDGRVAGVFIYGGDCELAGSPTVYTEVAFMRDWIDKHVDYD